MTEPTSNAPTGGASTATTGAARAHARSMAGTVVETMPTLPASSAPPPDHVAASDMLWHETVAGGGYTSIVAPRGTHIRFVDIEGDACAGVLLHHTAHRTERLNVALSLIHI